MGVGDCCHSGRMVTSKEAFLVFSWLRKFNSEQTDNDGPEPRGPNPWVDAFIRMHNGEKGPFLCPACSSGVLNYFDVAFGEGAGYERYIYCEHCRRYEVALCRNQALPADTKPPPPGW